jgi:hypothetical protein
MNSEPPRLAEGYRDAIGLPYSVTSPVQRLYPTPPKLRWSQCSNRDESAMNLGHAYAPNCLEGNSVLKNSFVTLSAPR